MWYSSKKSYGETNEMKCNRCNYPGELEWAQNYKPGDKPINSETGLKHIHKFPSKIRPYRDILSCGICETRLPDLYSSCPKCEINPGTVWLYWEANISAKSVKRN